MKPLHLNLAGRPYRDYRPLYAVVVVTSILIALMLLNNIETGYRYVRETRTTRDKIAQIESQIDTENRRPHDPGQRVPGGNGKPHPEPYLAAARLLGADLGACIAIEDSPPGVASAVAAGIPTIAVPHHVPVPETVGAVQIPTLVGLRPQDLLRLFG